MNGIQMMVREILVLNKDQKLQWVQEEVICTHCGKVAHGPHEIARDFYTRKTDSYKPNGKLGRRAGTVLHPCKECTNTLRKDTLCKN